MMPDTTVDLVARARIFAVEAHAGQLYDGAPYQHHLDECVAELRRVGAAVRAKGSIGLSCDDPEMLAAGYLHDVPEDTAVTQEQLAALFPARTAHAVAAVTDPPGLASRRSRKTIVLKRLAEDIDGSRLKLADRLANVRRCAVSGSRHLAMYRQEQPALVAAVTRHDCPCIRIMVTELDALLNPAIQHGDSRRSS